MQITDEQKQTLMFVYECIYSDYAKASRSREDKNLKKSRLAVWEKHLNRLQEINTACGLDDVTYKPLNKSEQV